MKHLREMEDKNAITCIHLVEGTHDITSRLSEGVSYVKIGNDFA